MDTKEAYFSVDVEASGPVPGDFSLLSIGACLVGDPEQSFYRELKPINKRFVRDALAVSGLSLARLAQTGAEPKQAMREFGAWVRTTASNQTPVMIAFNAGFDWAFVNWYFLHHSIDNPFGIGAVDIKSYYMGMVEASWEESRSNQLAAPYRSTTRHTHNALDDAKEQAGMFARMMVAMHGRTQVAASKRSDGTRRRP